MEISADIGNYRATMPLNGRPIAVRQAVMENAPAQVPATTIPIGEGNMVDSKML
jgi:hypothetical protein